MTNAHGCDISLWSDDNSTPQGVDFARMRQAGMSFVFIKASQAKFTDPDLIWNWARAKGQVYRGAYHFLVWDIPPAEQAAYFWSVIRSDPGELPPVVDFEWWGSVPSNAVYMLAAFCQEFERISGKIPMIYTSAQFWKERGNQSPTWTRNPLWLCDISGPVEVPLPWRNWTFHQYTFKLPGPAYGAESLDLDGNWYNGTVEDMRKRFNLAPLPDAVEVIGQRWRVKSTRNIRPAPSINSQPIDEMLAAGEILAALEYRAADGYNWMRHERGWSAIGTWNMMEAV